jgi:hypothetical protein
LLLVDILPVWLLAAGYFFPSKNFFFSSNLVRGSIGIIRTIAVFVVIDHGGGGTK